MKKAEIFNDLVKYLADKGCKFLVKYDYVNNRKSILGATFYKEGKFYKVNNVVVSKSMLSTIKDFIPLR